MTKGYESVKVFSFIVPEKPKSWTELARQGDSENFIHSIANHLKIEGGPSDEKCFLSLTMLKKN